MNKDNGGIINVFKPVGMTSFAVVSRIRKLTGVKKVGHCGTLDPFAEGVLPICIGRATAAVQFMDQYDKKYRVGMVFGVETDTQDLTGTVTFENKPAEEDLQSLRNNNAEPLYRVLASMTGIQEQLPPMYSAIKMNGRPLYEYARKGIEIERKKRQITIYEASVVDVNLDGEFTATVDIHCSKGTYIRTICVDIGRTLAYGAHAKSLLRTACGPFAIENSYTLEQIGEFLEDKTQPPLQRLREEQCLLPVEAALQSMPRAYLTKDQSLRIIQGQEVTYSGILPFDQPLLAFCEPDQFIGIIKARDSGEEGMILNAERIFVDVQDYQSSDR